ncbi:MAG: radical SAM protein [candidate division WOR-3 bacterium]
MVCKVCHKEKVGAKVLGLCVDCLRQNPARCLPIIYQAHKMVRERFGLPVEPPKSKDGRGCRLCDHRCQIGEGEKGYCGLREMKNGELKSRVSLHKGLIHTYLDPIPTNCCSAWFCPASRDNKGSYNLAVFAYGCSFNCLFCQNPQHKEIDRVPEKSVEDFINEALDERVSCVCFFGGSIEPQLPFALYAAKEILKRRRVRICWEWNGIGNENLVLQAAQISFESGGNVKFDLKAFYEGVSLGLSGVANRKAYENFALVAKEFFFKRKEPVLTATTLLVPGYVDEVEVEKIAEFIASLSKEIPYSLLIFHPDFFMKDLPVTPKEQVEACYTVAKRHLTSVNIGNLFLLNQIPSCDYAQGW